MGSCPPPTVTVARAATSTTVPAGQVRLPEPAERNPRSPVYQGGLLRPIHNVSAGQVPARGHQLTTSRAVRGRAPGTRSPVWPECPNPRLRWRHHPRPLRSTTCSPALEFDGRRPASASPRHRLGRLPASALQSVCRNRILSYRRMGRWHIGPVRAGPTAIDPSATLTAALWSSGLYPPAVGIRLCTEIF